MKPAPRPGDPPLMNPVVFLGVVAIVLAAVFTALVWMLSVTGPR